MNNITSTCFYIRDMCDYPELNAVYGRYFPRNPPARACVQVPMTDCIEMEIIAAEDDVDDAGVSRWTRKAMHVQSVSHWAPANIGPYSQAVELADQWIFISGQIGLVAGSMTLPEPPSFSAECALSLRHAQRILQAMHQTLNLHDAIQVFLYFFFTKKKKKMSI